MSGARSPLLEALHSALGALRRAGFEFWAEGDPFLDVDDTGILANSVRSGANVTAESEACSRLGCESGAAKNDASGRVGVVHARRWA